MEVVEMIICSSSENFRQPWPLSTSTSGLALPVRHAYVWELKVKFWFNLRLIWFRKNIRMGAKPCFSLCAAEFNSQLRNLKIYCFFADLTFWVLSGSRLRFFFLIKEISNRISSSGSFYIFLNHFESNRFAQKSISVLWSIRACSKDPDSNSDFEVEI